MATRHREPGCNLVLIGGRGCGKSSISRRIARENKHFIGFSCDALIRYEAEGRSIPEIVDERGWEGFRELEYIVVEKLANFERSLLIDCGGGVVVDLDSAGNEEFSDRKVEALRRHGLVVYLERDTDYLLERIAGDGNRPPLSEAESFREIMARRDPWYRRAAHHVLRCGNASKMEIVDSILEWFYAEMKKRGH